MNIQSHRLPIRVLCQELGQQIAIRLRNAVQVRTNPGVESNSRREPNRSVHSAVISLDNAIKVVRPAVEIRARIGHHTLESFIEPLHLDENAEGKKEKKKEK